MPDSPLAVGTSTSPAKYQSKTSATPSSASATYPSRDIDMRAITLVIVQLLSEIRRGYLEPRRTHKPTCARSVFVDMGNGSDATAARESSERSRIVLSAERRTAA